MDKVISDRNKSKVQIFLLLVVFVLFIMLANNIFKGFRFDLTENKLYTLGDGTLNIINDLQDEVTLNYYFSDSLTQDDTYLRAYAKRIKELLEEYELRSKGKIKLDGLLNEPDWKMVSPATDFIQRDPDGGSPSTEKTEVYVIYDEENLYIGGMLFDSNPDGILAYQKRRDQSLRTDDRFMWILDTFLDGRTGYFF